MLFAAVISLIILLSLQDNDMMMAIGRVADPENYPYALRIMSYRTKDATTLTYHHSCIGVLLSRSLLITSARCIHAQEDLSYVVKSYKLEELNLTPLVVDTLTVNNSMLVVDMNKSTTSSLAYFAFITLEFAVPLCQIGTDREYSVVKLAISDIYATQWIPIDDQKNKGDCVLLWYSDREEDEAIHLRRQFVSKWFKGVISMPNGPCTYRNSSNCNDAVLLCRYGSEAYRLVGIVSNFEANSTGKRLQSLNKDTIFGYETEVKRISDVLPQIRNEVVRLGKLTEMVVDSDRCDAFYAFNNGYHQD